MKKSLILSLFMVVVLIACKTKSSSVTPTKTVLEYLTGTGVKSWKVTGGEIGDGSGTSLPYLASQQSCITDNILVLNKNLTYQITEGASKCTTTAPDIFLQSEWKYTESPKTITIDKFSILNKVFTNLVFNISSIDDSKINGTTTLLYDGKNYTAKIEFTAVN